MSISSEITRISNAKTAIAESIANKGVTVPSGTKIDGMATLIDSIPTGGGGGDTNETWVLNESLNLINLSVSINFVSHNMSFIKFEVFNGQRSITRAGDISAAGLNYYTTSQNRVTIDPSLTSWKTNPYRKVTFATAPTGDLLTWLQSNAVKQASDTAVQPSKALTVTSNGTITITPDAPYDAIKQVNLTVNVSSGGNGFSVTFPATATNWDKVENASLLFSDGTQKPFVSYSSVSGQTIENVVGIICLASNVNYVLKMTLSKGKIALIHYPSSQFRITTSPGTTEAFYAAGDKTFWWPISDMVISSIEMYNTD